MYSKDVKLIPNLCQSLLRWLGLSVTLSVLVSCGGGSDDNGAIPSVNNPPVANAGPDLSVDTGFLVTLDGSGSSDVENDPLTYAWSLVTPGNSTTATLSDPTSASLTFTPDVDGTYTATLVVNDGTNADVSDTVTVMASTGLVLDPQTVQTVGYVGCSVTNNAVDGYAIIGGTKYWSAIVEYGGGGLVQWATDIGSMGRYWEAFQVTLDMNPDTDVIWLQLCSSEKSESDETLDNALLIIDEIMLRAPGLPIFVSAQPGYTDGHICRITGADGPDRMQFIADQLVQAKSALRGPVTRPLAEFQTIDGCHASMDGMMLLGDDLANFFGL